MLNSKDVKFDANMIFSLKYHMKILIMSRFWRKKRERDFFLFVIFFLKKRRKLFLKNKKVKKWDSNT